MWKTIVAVVIESFVYVDPMVHTAYITTKHQSEFPPEAAQVEGSFDRMAKLLLAEAPRVQEEAIA